MPEEPGATAQSSSPKREYDVYLEERKLLIDAAREGARTFDKAILTFAASAFAFSVAFLKEAAPHPARDSLIYLKVSWICFSISLLAIMLSFLFSQEACTWSIARTYDQLVVGRRQKSNPWSRWTSVLNYFTVVLLFVGITFWGLFVFVNMNQSEVNSSMSQKNPLEQRGYVPPPPPKRDIPKQNDKPPAEKKPNK